MREIKTEAKTIQDAVEKGLAELGMRRDQVEVVVVSEGKSGFLGIGARKACVILREKRWSGAQGDEPREGRGGRGPRRGGRGGRGGGDRGGRGGGDRGGRGERSERSSAAPRRPGRYGYEDARLPQPEEPHHEERPHHHRGEDRKRVDRIYKEEPLGAEYLSLEPAKDPVEHAKATLLKLLKLMGFEATIAEARLDSTENLLFIRFDCADSATFTEENGRALQSLQFVLNSIVSRKREPHLALRLDTGGYWDNKEKEIAGRVEEAVNAARKDRPFSMEPMPASMRKIVHNLIKTNYPDMETVSEGEGRWRKVVVSKIERPQEQQAPQREPEQAPEPAPETQPEQQQPERQEAAKQEEKPAEQPTEQK